MPNPVIAATLPCWKTAAGWVFLVAVLTNYTDLISFSVVLCSLCIAEILSQLLIAGIATSQSNRTDIVQLEGAIAQAMLRWLVLTGFCFCAASLNGLFFYQHYSFALVCTLGLSLILASTRVVLFSLGTHGASIEKLMQMHLILLAILIIVFAQVGTLNSDTILTLSVALMLCVLASTLRKLSLYYVETPERNTPHKPQHASVFAVVHVLFRHADLLVLPWLFVPEIAFSYLIARGAAHAIGLTLGTLNPGISKSLTIAFENAKYNEFVAVAARVNLGILLIGGSVCLATLAIGPYLFDLLGVEPRKTQTVLMWAVFAEATPVFFGATWLLLNIVQMKRQAMLLGAVGIAVIWGVVIFFEISDVIELAMLFAGVHLSCAAVAATLLCIKFGIWPGLTAVLFKRIKLI